MKKILLLCIMIIATLAALSQNRLSRQVLNPSNGLVAYYPFNGNANDESGNGNDGVVSGATLTADRFGNSGSAYNFNGSSDYISTSNVATMATDNWSITAWIKPATLNQLGSVVINGFDDGGGSNNGYSILLGNGVGGTGNNLTGLFSNVEWINPNLTLNSNNEWYHVAMVRKNGTTTLYLNGVAGSVNTTAAPVTPSGSLRIGSQNGLRFFNGAIDDVTLLSEALSDEQVSQLFSNESSGLIAFYPFNGNANDESGFNNNPTYIGSGVTLTSDRFGRENSAYYLDGTANSSYIRIPADNFPTGNRTISFWFNADEVTNRPTPLCYGGNGCNSTCFMIHINNANLPNAYMVQGHCNDAVITAPYTTDPVNKWYQFTVTINENVQKIYVNGILQQTASNYTTPTYVNGKSVIIGDVIYIDGTGIYQSSYAGPFKGKLDDFRFYNRAMTDSQVYSLYKSEAENLVAFCPFDGNAKDASGNGHDGIVYGGILTDDRNSNPNSAYTFPNLHNQITLANTTDLNLQGGFTLSSWVKYKSVNSGIIGKHSCWVPNGFYLGIENQQLILRICDGGWYETKTSETFENDKWYMITGVFDSVNQTGSIFVDGRLKASNHATYTVFNTVPITISEASNGCPDGNMPGAIDDVRIYSRPLSESEILHLYQSSGSGLAAFYPFSGNAADASGNMNDGSVNNAQLTTDRYGNSNRAYAFDGKDSFIEGTTPGNNLPQGNCPRTFVGWIKENSFHPWGNNIFHYGLDQAAPTNFHFYTTDVIRIGNGYDFGVVAGSTPVVDSIWHFVAGVYQGGTEHIAKVYVDGKLNNAGYLSSEPNTVLGSNWKIGRFMTGVNNFDGKIDDLRIYSTALTDQEIESLYLSETTAPQLLKPENLSVVSGLTPLMEWSNINPDPEYTFQLSAEPGFAQTLYQSKTSQPHVQLPEGLIDENVTYYWRVRATLNGETGPWSDTRSFSSVNTGIAERRTNQAKLTITPNPADNSGRITYHIPSSKTGLEMVSVEIINATGKSVRKLVSKKQYPGAYDLELNTKMLPAGVYYIKLLTESGSVTSKMVVVH